MWLGRALSPSHSILSLHSCVALRQVPSRERVAAVLERPRAFLQAPLRTLLVARKYDSEAATTTGASVFGASAAATAT